MSGEDRADKVSRRAAKAAEAAAASEAPDADAEAAACKAARKAAKAAGKEGEAGGAAAPADDSAAPVASSARPKKKASFAAYKAEKLGTGGGKKPAGTADAKSSKKRKRDESVGKPAPEKAPAADGEKKKKKGKRGKKKTVAPEEAVELPDNASEEEKRRSAQKEVQQLVLRLQKEGKSKHEVIEAKTELKRKQGSFRDQNGMKVKKIKLWNEFQQTEDYKKEEEDTKKENKERKHDLVVIPIIWRGRHDAREVEGAAEDVKACLAQQGLDVWIDSRRHYTPGQKFAHWEHRGVMLRVEIGPDDFKAGVCLIAKAKEPGQYLTVEKKKVRLPPRGSRALLLQLKEFGLSQIDIERRKGDSDSEGEEPAAAAGKTSGADGDVDDDLAGNVRLAARPAKDGKKYKKL